MTEELLQKAVAIESERRHLNRLLTSIDERMDEYHKIYGSSDELTNRTHFEELMRIMDYIDVDTKRLYVELCKVLLRQVVNHKTEMTLRLEQIEAEIKSL